MYFLDFIPSVLLSIAVFFHTLHFVIRTTNTVQFSYTLYNLAISLRIYITYNNTAYYKQYTKVPTRDPPPLLTRQKHSYTRRARYTCRINLVLNAILMFLLASKYLKILLNIITINTS